MSHTIVPGAIKVTDEYLRDVSRKLVKLHLVNPVFRGLRMIAHEIGVSRIVLARRIGSDDIQGQYFPPSADPEKVSAAFQNWDLSDRQSSLIRGALNREKAAIVINAFADDHCEVLRHELGHHIAVYLCGLNGVERFIDPPTKAMREDSRLDEYCLSSRNEALAESFGLYLEGAPMRHINLKPLLRRVCMNNTRAFSILRNYRKALA